MITAKLKEEVETMRKEILSKTLSIEELKINEPSSRPSTPSLQELSNEEQKNPLLKKCNLNDYPNLPYCEDSNNLSLNSYL